MRISSLILPLLAAINTVMAQPITPTSRESALEALLAQRESIDSLNTAITTARKSGVSEQAILEAQFLYHVDRRDDRAIAAMLPQFLKQRDIFQLADSAIFSVNEDWLAVIEYVQAIASLQQGNRPAFKKHITEAFWLSPKQAAAYAPHIERIHLEERMRTVTLDWKTLLTPLTTSDPLPLDSLISEKKALLLHFWSPWSPECEASIPDFTTTAALLISHHIAIASILPDDSPKLLTDARSLIRPLTEKPCGSWLIDSKKNPLSRQLHIQNLPTMVLISTTGKVLFHGDPTQDEFWQSLQKINPTIQRPISEDPKN